MAKRKRQAKGSSSKSEKAKVSRPSDDLYYPVDLRGRAATPDALKSYLQEHYSSPPTNQAWSIQTDQFPRGCMQVLLDHLADNDNLAIAQFQNHYGKVYKYQLQNPDLKLLVKTHGRSLTHLRMTPLFTADSSTQPPSPKLQGCGYRWTTLHAQKLQVLELSLQYDVKQQLLDFSRKTPLLVEQLQELILRQVGANTTRPQLIELVNRAKCLQSLILTGVELDDDNSQDEDLALVLEQAAKKAGNDALVVQVEQAS